jgi:RimK family alpha-L-glutamate ligase
VVRIAIISARPELTSNRRLVEAASAVGIEAQVVDGCQCTASVDGAGIWRVVSGGGELEPPDGVIARVGNWRPKSLLAVLEALVGRGAVTANPPAAIRVGRDHWRTIERLSAVGVPVPETMAGADPERLAADAVRLLGLPVVVKQRRSRMGVGVIRCDSRDHLESVLDSLWRLGDEVVVQRWVPGGSTSYRLLVAGADVVAAARFSAGEGEWRSNGARGGRAEAYSYGHEEADLARTAAASLGLGQCGVDLLRGPDGPLVVEVNPTPGFSRVEAATGLDVAGAFVAHLSEMVSRR